MERRSRYSGIHNWTQLKFCKPALDEYAFVNVSRSASAVGLPYEPGIAPRGARGHFSKREPHTHAPADC
jgi:hypothetical protein